MNKGLWYFAHPYTCKDNDGNYVPEGEDANFRICNYRAGRLLARGYNIYSPISHTHPIHRACPVFLGNHEHDLWYNLDLDVIAKTDFTGIILGPGWKASKGCGVEKETFEDMGKPVLYYDDLVSHCTNEV